MRNVLMVVFTVVLAFALNAQDRFDKSAFIPLAPEDIGGVGNMVSGVDFDGDGKIEIYAVSNDWHDQTGLDLIPRIYKFETNDDGRWEAVWSTRLDLEFQNTWPPLAAADLDNDGKHEIVWGPVNNFGGGLQPNPPRIVVFETPGDGSDNMGIDNGDGTWRPNSTYNITDNENENIRPFRWAVEDVDSDGTPEIVSSFREGNGIQIFSVDNVPDTGDSTETWTQEFASELTVSGFSGAILDMAILNGTIYGFRGTDETYSVAWDADSAAYIESGPQTGLGFAGPWNSATVVDIDGDGTDEALVANGWFSSAPGNVLLVQQDGDSLTSTVVGQTPGEVANRLYGGAAGDIDNDGNLDFVFGTRSANPNGAIFRLEHQGGAIDDAANYEISIIDQEAWPTIQYDVFAIANVDDDPEDEVLYTGTPRGKSAEEPPPPIFVLDKIPANQPIIGDVVDVPNDQGRQVWVVWKASADDISSPPPGEGTVDVAISAPEGVEFPYMEIDGKVLTPVQATDKSTDGNTSTVPIIQYVVWRIDGPGLPVQVADVIPIQAPYYAAVVPTLGDGEEWAGTYVVSAHTGDVTQNWKSFPRHGISEDNLIPTAPENVTAGLNEGRVVLTWDESPDPDFNYFSVRRGNEPGFDASMAAEIGTTTSTEFADSDVQGGETWYYRVVAFDFNANEGELSEEVFAVITGIGDNEGGLPREFALHHNFPNPFNPETTIAFDLPKSTDVTLKVYNARGQLVKTLVNGNRSAGKYQVTWNGTDNFGNRVASGLYIYSIKAGEFTQNRKMTLLK